MRISYHFRFAPQPRSNIWMTYYSEPTDDGSVIVMRCIASMN